MARRNQHSREELQDLAVAAVLEIAERDGVHAVSARSVARQIGYAPGMLYHLFENRDDLILHANARTLDTLAAAMEKAAAKKNAGESPARHGTGLSAAGAAGVAALEIAVRTRYG